MKKILSFILFVTLVFASCSDDEASVRGTAKGELNGKEIKADIKVILYTESASVYKTTLTDTAGNFSFSNVSSGNYYIGATKIIENDTIDTGNMPQSFYVGDKIDKEVALSLKKK
jgi:hypothetical protein